MQKVKVRIYTLLASFVVVSVVSVFVLGTESIKKTRKAQAYYLELASSWLIYKNEYESQANALKLSNTAKMAEAKSQYEALLTSQPNLIAQHTRTRQDPTAGQQYVGAVTSPSGGSTQTIKVSKPKSKPSTKAS